MHTCVCPPSLSLLPPPPKAYVSLVVTETERQMTWSRLEGLRFHWAVSRAPPPGQKWELPPRGWVTAPDTSVDAGGAWQSVFEKHPLPQPGGTSGPEPLYSLVVGVSGGWSWWGQGGWGEGREREMWVDKHPPQVTRPGRCVYVSCC